MRPGGRPADGDADPTPVADASRANANATSDATTSDVNYAMSSISAALALLSSGAGRDVHDECEDTDSDCLKAAPIIVNADEKLAMAALTLQQEPPLAPTAPMILPSTTIGLPPRDAITSSSVGK